MKFIEKNLTASACGEQIKSAIPCTFRSHAAAVKAAGVVHYVDANGIERTFSALSVSVDPLVQTADKYDDEVIASCLIAAGYRSGRDLTALEDAVKTAESAAAPLIKRDDGLRKAAIACSDAAKHADLLHEIDKNGPALGAARDALAKARAALDAALDVDIRAYMRGFEKRSDMLIAVSKWLYEHAADRFAAIAQAADNAVRAFAGDFSGRMLSYVDYIAADDTFPVNQKGRRCSCAGNVESAIIKAVKRPFNGGVGYRHTATGGTRYCDVPLKSGREVEIHKVTTD